MEIKLLMLVKAAIGFANSSSDAELIKKVQAIIVRLTNNPNFNKPAPGLDVVSATLAAFVTALAEAKKGDRELVVIKNVKRTELVAVLRKLANYVTDEANGDLAKLLSSDFPIQKPTRSKVGKLNPPDSPKARHGADSGTITASVTPVYGASSYIWEVALSSAPTSPVASRTTIGGRCDFAALTPGQMYSVRVRAVGAAGPSDFSDDAEIRSL